MTTSTTKQAVTFLLHAAATKMLADSPSKTAVQKSAESAYGKLRAQCSPEELAGVDFIASIMTRLANQLVRAENVDQLELASSYVEALIAGEVLVAKENGELVPQAN